MAKPKWGDKRDCLNCGARFYDLGHEPAVCPKCGADVVTQIKPKLTPRPVVAKPPASKAGAESSTGSKASGAAGGDKADELADAADDALIDDEEEVFDPAEAEKK